MLRKPKIMLMGYGRHGKDTCAEYLRDRYGLSFESSSWACAEKLFPLLSKLYGYKTVKECFERRHETVLADGKPLEMRVVWHELIKLYNDNDPAALGKLIYAKNDIYVGIRNYDEYMALRHERAFDVAVWIDASKRLPPEGEGSCTVKPCHADEVIDNNRSLNYTYRQLDQVMRRAGAY